MNIFVFHPSVHISALWLDDVRKNKMITESCQIMSTAANCLVGKQHEGMYRNFNPAHGSNRWAMSSYSNYLWLLRYTTCLLDQRPLNADGTPHACTEMVRHIFPSWLENNAKSFRKSRLTPFSNNAANEDVGVNYKWMRNTVIAYRCYINDRWNMDKIKLSWNFGQEPKWRKVN